MNLQVNDLVKHPVKPEWGVGRVIEIEDNGITTVHFSRYGKTVIDLSKVTFSLLKLERTREALIQYHKEFLDEKALPYRGIRIRSAKVGGRSPRLHQLNQRLIIFPA
jgi:hypothetical protein